MNENYKKTQSSCFSLMRLKGSLPLMSMQDNINIYKNIHAKKVLFGMDIHVDEFEHKDFVIFQNSGYINNQIPMCCSFYTLILNIKGEPISYVNQYKYDVKEKSLQLLVPGVLYSFEDIKDDKESLIIFFEHDFLSSENLELLEFFQKEFEPNTLTQETYMEVLSIFKLLNQEYKHKKTDYQEYSKLLLLQIIYLLKREKSTRIVKSVLTRSQQITNHYLALIEEDFQTKKTVQEYANILDITSKHLSETIRETLNESALFLIHKRIIKEIQYQLCYTTLSIKEISSTLYFSNSSDFGRFFKRHKKLSPRDYRLKFQII